MNKDDGDDFLNAHSVLSKNTDSNDESTSIVDNNNIFENIDHSALKESGIKLIQQLMHGDVSNLKNAVSFHHPNLSAPPTVVEDKFSAVLGDGFHCMQRIRVPTNYYCKKRFHVSLREAFFSWDPDILQKVKDKKIKIYTLSDDDIDSDMCFNADWWQERVFRKISPPSLLHWRVRSVCVFYGDKVDTISSAKALFNKLVWNKANNDLQEILDGNVSDPPNLQFRMHQLDKKGNLKKTRISFTCIAAQEALI